VCPYSHIGNKQMNGGLERSASVTFDFGKFLPTPPLTAASTVQEITLCAACRYEPATIWLCYFATV
jgi:hypothetical protein